MSHSGYRSGERGLWDMEHCNRDSYIKGIVMIIMGWKGD